MMKRNLTFCAFLFALHALHAATAFPAAASNYVFTTPLRPAQIRGLVMGTPPAYYVPRSEDFDWLHEAYVERLDYRDGVSPAETNTTLAAEFGKWALSETNRFYRWVTAVDAAGVTNVVVGFNLVTNITQTSDSPLAETDDSFWWPGEAAAQLWNPTGADNYLASYLDPAVSLVAGSRVYGGSGIWTNVYALAAYTNAVTNAFSVITMPMTNGTVSVYTNRWIAIKRFPYEIVYTNLVNAGGFHYCQTGEGPFPGYTNAPPLGLSRGAALFSVPSVISNDYVALRGAVRLADAVSQPNNAPLTLTGIDCRRGVGYTNDVYASYADIQPAFLTNVVTTVTTNNTSADWLDYSMVVTHDEWQTTVYYIDVDALGNEVTNSTVKTESAIDSRESGVLSDTAVLYTRFPSDLVMAGGAMRVAVEAVYADVRIRYSNKSDGENPDYTANIDTNVVLRLAAPALDVTGADAVATVAMDSRAICAAAAVAAGAPQPPAFDDGDPGVDRIEAWYLSVRGFYLFYQTTPNSRLSDW